MSGWHTACLLLVNIFTAVSTCRYTLMLHCWELDPKDRPTFAGLVNSLSQSMESMASYMDVGAFGQPLAGGGMPSDTVETVSGVSIVNEETCSNHSLEKEAPKDEHCEVTLELAGSTSDETCL